MDPGIEGRGMVELVICGDHFRALCAEAFDNGATYTLRTPRDEASLAGEPTAANGFWGLCADRNARFR